MRILHLTPGSGGTFYCQNCLRDLILVRALRARGHDAVVVPLYLPMFGDSEGGEGRPPIFFGGINVYLREKIPFFRRAPRWLERILDSPWALSRAAKREGSTNAAGLGAMTLSMLEGREGNQRREYQRFLEWLTTQPRPDIIHISNALLLGFIPAIREVLDTPFVCSLQDEAPWVDAMRPPYDQRCWDAMARLGGYVGRFVATSRWYAGLMTERMRIPDERMAVVYPGIETEGIAPADPSFTPPTIGFLSRLNEAQGLGILIDAFIKLKQDPAFKELRLVASGGATPADQPYLSKLEDRLAQLNISDAVTLQRSFQTAPDPSFFKGLTVFSAPVPKGEAFGIQLIEAMARGIPVVQPRVGAYPEVIQETGGGVIYDPARENGLADALRKVLTDPEGTRAMGNRGRESVLERFNISRATDEMLTIYQSLQSNLK